MMSGDMDLNIEKVGSKRRICSASSASEFVVDVSPSDATGNVISLSRREQTESGDSKLDDSILKWEKLRNEQFATHAVYDVKGDLLFALLKDRQRIAVLNARQKQSSARNEYEARKPGFSSGIFSLISLHCNQAADEGDVVIAVSTSGELEAFCYTANGDVGTKALESVHTESVLYISTFGDDHLLVLGLRQSKVLIYPLRFHMRSGFHSIEVEQYPHICLPAPPPSIMSSKTVGDSFVLGFVLTESYSFVLYFGGFVQILSPVQVVRERHKGSLLAWYKDVRKGIPQHDVELKRPAHAFRLSPGSAEENSVSISDNWKDVKKDAGEVTIIGDNYVAIGYGQYVSIWDGVHGVDHAFAQVDGRVTAVCSQKGSWNALVGSENGFVVLEVGNRSPLSLGLALKRKGSCDPIVIATQQPSEVAPLHSQPVTVAAMKVAAETEGSTEHVFRPIMDSLDAAEMRMVRALVDRSATGSPEAVARLTRHYTTELRKVRRGHRGKASDLGLAKLPSERLASISVARCLYEIHFGHVRYIVPLIDMLGTGVVSSEAVLPVVEMSDSWKMGSKRERLVLRSVIDPLTSSPIFLNGLEAIICRVSDLPESDAVRVVQFAVRLIEERYEILDAILDQDEERVSQHALDRRRELAQAVHLLFKCFTAPVDRRRIVEALRKVPFADALAILRAIDGLLADALSSDPLSAFDVPVPTPLIRKGFFFGNTFDDAGAALYRGVGNWLDADEQERDLEFRQRSSGVSEWASYVIDAHLATLILDEKGRDLASKLLDTVRARRRHCEVLGSLHGLASHLSCHAPLPTHHDPLYKVTVLDVPNFAALK